ncbi:YwdI family protein [Virgibacillus kekensis]|uniref:YwdI family protein n=1 Tax=Virgibacillus kekensis TaxID=202261 RepID=A0ABV9DH47_9BACI
MAVSENTIIKKMMNELKQAQNNAGDNKTMKQHIANVKLLSELLLDEKQEEQHIVNTDITEEEMKAMIGETGTGNKRRTVQLDDDDANGSSLFDF